MPYPLNFFSIKDFFSGLSEALTFLDKASEFLEKHKLPPFIVIPLIGFLFFGLIIAIVIAFFVFICKLIGTGRRDSRTPSTDSGDDIALGALYAIPRCGILTFIFNCCGFNFLTALTVSICVLLFYVSFQNERAYKNALPTHINKIKVEQKEKNHQQIEETEQSANKNAESINAERSADHEQKG